MGKNILLLQGVMGPFFSKLEKYLEKEKNANTLRIGFNASDWLFSRKFNYTPFKGTRDEWRNFFIHFTLKNKIDTIYIFGDCRFYQSVAILEAKKAGIDVFIFEEGYIRPNFITLEQNGVNDYSSIPRERSFYESLPEITLPEEVKVKNSFFAISVYATIYYLFANIFFFKYPNYHHHRHFSALHEFFYFWRNMSRKLFFKFTERNSLKKLLKKEDGFFFVPLQTRNDFQISVHSDYLNIEEFIDQVLLSFSLYAPQNVSLVFKHHPIDRGKRLFTSYIKKTAKSLQIDKRVEIVHDVHLPTLLRNAKGTVTINSTVGISSLFHNTPTITLGRAIYNIDGLTYQGNIDTFWTNAQPPEDHLFESFKKYIIHSTQYNGAFYGEFPKGI